MDNGERFGTWLRDRLEERGISQSSLARSMDVSVTTINRWVNEERRPQARFVPLLARALNVSVDEVMVAAGLMSEGYARVGPRARLLDIISWLPDEEIETVLAFTEFRADRARAAMRLPRSTSLRNGVD